jgi:hypothetical protein
MSQATEIKRLHALGEVTAQFAALAPAFARVADGPHDTFAGFVECFHMNAGRFIAGSIGVGEFRAICNELGRDARGSRGW